MVRGRPALVALLAVTTALVAVLLVLRGWRAASPELPASTARTSVDEGGTSEALVRPAQPLHDERRDVTEAVPGEPNEVAEPRSEPLSAPLPPCTIVVRLVTEQGVGVPGAVVRVLGALAGVSHEEQVADAEGRLTVRLMRPVEGEARKLSIGARAPGRETIAHILEPSDVLRLDGGELELVMGPSTWLEVVVRDGFGKVAANAQVRLMRDGDSGDSVNWARLITDAEGRARADGLRPGRWGVQVVAWRDYWDMESFDVTLQLGGERIELEVDRMDAVDYASGRILSSEGDVLPQEGYEGLYLRRHEHSNSGGGIHEDGRFFVKSVSADIEAWEVADRSGPRSAPFNLAAGWHDVTVNLLP